MRPRATRPGCATTIRARCSHQQPSGSSSLTNRHAYRLGTSAHGDRAGIATTTAAILLSVPSRARRTPPLGPMCYNCDEQYALDHKCQRLFYIEVTDPDAGRMPNTKEIQPAVDTPVLSLHAMARIRMEETMQLHFSIATQQFVALLDSSSSHNFIHPLVARQVGLTFHSSAGAHVTVANGGRVACQGHARDVAIRLRAELFSIDCYSVPLDSYDMVLGATFQCTLGPFLWDFDDSCITFWQRGHHVLRRGLGPCPDAPARDRLNTVHGAATALLGHPTTIVDARSRSAGVGTHRSAFLGPSFNLFGDPVMAVQTPPTSRASATCSSLTVVSRRASWMDSFPTTLVCFSPPLQPHWPCSCSSSPRPSMASYRGHGRAFARIPLSRATSRSSIHSASPGLRASAIG